MMASKKDKNQQVQVFVRVRPLNSQEGFNSCVEIKGHKELTLKHHATQKTYMFDKVFGPESKQIDVYKMVAEPLVQEVIAGYNCTILAYGQTGTGKTYTMAGGNIGETANWSEDVHSGIIPRTLSHLFDLLRMQQVEHTVRISYLELYNEEIFDLLSPVEDNSKLKLYDDSVKKGSVIVMGLTETTVETKAEVFRILEKGAEKRRVASTLMNAHSSRSHTVFCINVHTKENSIDGEDLLKTGKLYLVDLAGSENIKHSGVTEGRARETFSINQSLLTLGRCINKLNERSSHIPYRESKLTRLLQDSLGGRTKTTLIATVGPALCNYDESMNTLDYAHRAKNITNKPEINQRLSKKTLLKEYTEEIERLRKDLQATRAGKGIFVDEENYDALMRQRNEHKEQMAEKVGRIQALQEEMCNKEQLCEQLKISLEQHEQEVRVKVNTILALETQLQQASNEIHQLKDQNDLTQYMVDKLSDTERQLQNTARELLTVADVSTNDARKLHDKVQVLTDLNKQNKQVVEQHFMEYTSKIDNISNKLVHFDDRRSSFLQTMHDQIDNCNETNMAYLNTYQSLANEIHSWSHNFISQLSEIETSKQSFSQTSDTTHSNISKHLKTLVSVCRDDFINLLIPNFKNLFQLANEQVDNVNEFIKNSKQLLQEDQNLNNTFSSDVQNKIVNEKQVTKKYFTTTVQTCDDDMKDNVVTERTNLNYRTKRNEQIETLLHVILGMKNAADQYDKMVDEQEQKRKKRFESLRSDMNEGIDVCCTAEQMVKLLAEQTDSRTQRYQQHEHILTAAQTSNQEHHQQLLNTNSTLQDAQQQYLQFTDKQHIEIENNCIREISLQEEIFDNHLTNQYSIVTEAKKEVGNISDEAETKVNELHEHMSSLLDEMRKDVETNDVAQTEVRACVSTEIDSCREGMRRLFAGSLQEYKATGETPQRKAYRYPRSLAETKARDQLIEEYRACHDIPETDEKENDTENVNASKIPKLLQKQNAIIENDSP